MARLCIAAAAALVLAPTAGAEINLGFAHTSGEIMAYLNSDDLLLPGALHTVARYFADHPDVDVVYGHRVVIDRHGDEPLEHFPAQRRVRAVEPESGVEQHMPQVGGGLVNRHAPLRFG